MTGPSFIASAIRFCLPEEGIGKPLLARLEPQFLFWLVFWLWPWPGFKKFRKQLIKKSHLFWSPLGPAYGLSLVDGPGGRKRRVTSSCSTLLVDGNDEISFLKFRIQKINFLQIIPWKSCRVHFRWPFLLLPDEQKKYESFVFSSVGFERRGEWK